MDVNGTNAARILITGAGGMLGRAVADAAAAAGLVHHAFTRAELDITQSESVAAGLAETGANVVINCAAYTNVDGAESEPAAAIAANALGPAVLARETSRRDGVLIHISTDHVFAGEVNRPYRATDPVGPRSVYGRSKLQGEDWVRQLQPRHYVVRTAGLFGLGGRNFVAAIAERAAAGKPLRVVADQVCQRTYSRDLAEGLLELATSDADFGLYHVTNHGYGSWYEFAAAIAARVNPSVAVDPVTSAEWGAAAWRPAWSVLDDAAWRGQGLAPLREVSEAVDSYLAELWPAAASAGVLDEELG